MNFKSCKKIKSLKKIMINALIFCIFICLTFSVIFQNNSISELLSNIKQVNILFIILAIIAMFIFIMCEGINIKMILKTCGHKISFLQSFKYALVGFFFSSITPSASGGQPAQIYFMSKDKIPLSHSTLSLLVVLSSFQLASCTIAFLSFIFNYNILNTIGYIKYFIFFGLTLNILILLCLLIMIISKKFALKLLNIICKLLKLFHYKKIDFFKEKFLESIDEYHNCSTYLKSNKSLIFKIITISIIQLSFYHSIPFFVYKSFGLNDFNILNIISMSSVLYISVSSLPLPGAMGISEGGFMILFKMFFPTSILSSAMIIYRGISYYLFIIISGFLIVLYILINNFIHKKNYYKNHN